MRTSRDGTGGRHRPRTPLISRCCPTAARSPPRGSCGGRRRNSGGRSGRCPANRRAARNRDKARVKLARAHARVADARREFCHQLSTALIRENQAVAVEDLAVNGLARTRLAKSVHDAGWSAFVHMLEYKARLYGREFRRIGRFEPTSQVCSACGARDGPKPLHVRTWRCRGCGAWLDRDINAAVNVARAAGLAVTACGAQVRPEVDPGAARRSRNPPEATPVRGVTGGISALQGRVEVNPGPQAAGTRCWSAARTRLPGPASAARPGPGSVRARPRRAGTR